ncbi:hypothetical protein D3C76_160560 [compost metagenome]
MATIDSAQTRGAEKRVPFYQLVAQSSLMFLGGLVMLAAASGLMMELLYGTL